MSREIYFLPHGGGPLPLMGNPGHKGIVDLMRGLGARLAGPPAVVVVTAHWEAEAVAFSGAERPPLLFDYYGFPPETYDYVYPAPGAPELARRAAALLGAAGLASRIDAERGYDHGTFVPMMLIRPAADIPILQMSLLASLDPAAHIAVGKALAPLVDDGAVLIGSGLSFHNLGALLRGTPMPADEDRAFDDWLNETLLDPALGAAERDARLAAWAAAPGARFCHPREDHLLPLHVCHGAAAAAGLRPANIYRDRLMGFMTSGFRWRSE
jgi:aromatic ring-opening dioxygenase catalytic subunit (LigB family)